MGKADTTDQAGARRLGRVALIAVVTVVVLILVAVGVYVIAFVILSPMMG
ncbi:hypothetical protein [Mycobacterium xenopi]|uniref:Uncharacterized protein n=2 Tax=Mycobacterium xenopi TaxID=1789 RepID=A0AAD1H2G7_MYCXE|nr:hypothetical protein [Mycobacterium xenopi]EUA07082.1 hypothetical protein I553_0323 [Mycobacterium xenopi 4042]EUA19379.1 hypothetical protein I552_9122 [Mycobacterium xenopi 3993]MDA3638607.1 hypothetical protein [Mycobacterium xenopi]MDA3656690.1 hypothetical protein [Mycobacterium xenopi]MDA3664427.1 hypothetical protein [Mycobacterium xenopi]